MSARRWLNVTILLASAGLPVVIGASCPPASIPPYLSLLSPEQDTGQTTPLPSCVEGFVCISFLNKARVPVEMALYTHNGFDPNDQYPGTPTIQCCTNPNSPVSCPCPCEGKDTGDCMLTRPQIYLPANLDTINGQNVLQLLPNASTLKRERCGNVKTMAAAVALATGDVLTAPVDQTEPVYRDEPGGVPCGETVQFSVTDLNQSDAGTGGTDLVTLVIDVEISSFQ